MKFFLKRNAEGRVYLSQIAPVNSEEILDEIDAESWIKAREKTRKGGYERFEHKPGYGYH